MRLWHLRVDHSVYGAVVHGQESLDNPIAAKRCVKVGMWGVARPTARHGIGRT